MVRTPTHSLVYTHCHILPGIDDGVADSGISLEMASIAAEDRIGTIIVTPHVIDGLCTADFIQDKVEDLQALLDDRGISLRLMPGAELAISMCLGGQKDVYPVSPLPAGLSP